MDTQWKAATDQEKRDMGERIARLRKRLNRDKRGGFTQREVAEMLGISREGYSHYELGHNEIGVATLTKLAGLFGVPVSYFFEENVVEPEVMRTARYLLGFDADEVEKVFSYAAFLKSQRLDHLDRERDHEAMPVRRA